MKLREQSPRWRRVVGTLGRQLFRWSENNDDPRPTYNGEHWLLRRLLECHAKRAQGAWVVFDGGANAGDYTRLVLQTAQEAGCTVEVHAFEPAPRNVERLQQAFGAAVRVVGSALSDRTGSAALFAGESGSSQASLVARSTVRAPATETIQVPLLRLGDYLTTHAIARIDLLKLDVEGSELAALRGLGEALRPERVDVIQFEYGGTTADAGTSLREIYQLLESRGFILAKLFPAALEVRPFRAWMENYAYANYVALAPRWRTTGQPVERAPMKPPRSTVIYTYGAGRLGNQIVRFAHWIAWARIHPGQVEICNFSFWPYADYFVTWREHPGCVFPLRRSPADRWARWRAALPRWLRTAIEARSRLQRAVQAAGRWWPGWQAVALNIVQDESMDLSGQAFFERVASHPVTTCCGWRIADWPQVAEQQAELREYFRPVPQFEKPAKAFIAALRERHDLVIGVLIRQSDYRSWEDGRFYFSTVQYAGWIRQLVELHRGRRVAVVVSSDERQDPQAFVGLPVYLTTDNPKSDGHWFEDWIKLSLCDFIVSVPSTFSATAAFLGGVPLWPVVSADQIMDSSQLINDGMIGAARHPIFSRSVK